MGSIAQLHACCAAQELDSDSIAAPLEHALPGIADDLVKQPQLIRQYVCINLPVAVSVEYSSRSLLI